jgi:hypothetical protein
LPPLSTGSSWQVRPARPSAQGRQTFSPMLKMAGLTWKCRVGLGNSRNRCVCLGHVINVTSSLPHYLFPRDEGLSFIVGFRLRSGMGIGQLSNYGRTCADLDWSPRLNFVNLHPYIPSPCYCAGKTYKVSIFGPSSQADYCQAVGLQGYSIPRIAVSNDVTLPTLPASPSARPNVEFKLTAPLTLAGSQSNFYFIALEGTGSTTQVPTQGAMAVCGDNVTQPNGPKCLLRSRPFIGTLSVRCLPIRPPPWPRETIQNRSS